MSPSVCIFAPYDFNNIYGNTLRPLMECQGLLENGFDDFYLLCLKKNPALPFEQREFNRGLLSSIPDKFRLQSVAYLYDMPWFKKVDIPTSVKLVHAHNFYSYFAIDRKKTKVLMDLHTCKGNEISNTYKNQNLDGPLKRFVFRKLVAPFVKSLEKKICLREESIIVASPNIGDVFARDFKIENEKFITINNLINPSHFKINKHEKSFVIGVVGGFKDNINREQIDVVAEIAKRTTHPIILFGSIYKEDEERLRHLKSVNVLGKVSDEEYRKWMSEMSVLLAPYPTYRDGGGLRNKIMEAAACNTPIITSLGGAEGFMDKDLLHICENTDDYIQAIETVKQEIEEKRLNTDLKEYALKHFDYKAISLQLKNQYLKILSE